MVEALVRMMSNKRNAKQIQGLKPSSNNEVISHHQFVDDIILISKALLWEVVNLNYILVLYGPSSHQKVNFKKTKIFFFNTPIRRQKNIIELSQYHISDFHLFILGCHYLWVELRNHF